MTEPAPARPILALTLALAGKRKVDATAIAPLRAALGLTFDTVAARLGELSALAGQANDPLAARFSGDTARLTLVSGLADGVDMLGPAMFVTPSVHADNPRRILGAVLPCGRDDFVNHSSVSDRTSFDLLWDRCSFIIDVGAPMPISPSAAPPGSLTPDEEKANRRDRGYAFSAQSEVLLRNADILVAVDDPDDDGKTGGTRDSVRKALDVGMPVILIRLGEPGLAVLRTRADFDEPRMIASDVAAGETVRALVDDVAGYKASLREDDYVKSLFAEFFAGDARKAGALGSIWTWFESRFKKPGGGGGGSRGGASSESPAYAAYKKRASDLSGAYAGQYRGSFLAGYGLAVLAVGAAVTSLTIMALQSVLQWPLCVELGVLAALGLLKLWAVASIFQLSTRGHRMRLAHRAADFRYLSERLRAMQFLPRAGWMRAPANWSLPYTTRLSAQGVMDRLFAAIVRQADPLLVMGGTRGDPLVSLDPVAAEKTIRDAWLAEQGRYHDRNHETLDRMSGFLEKTNRVLNLLVMTIAGIDLVILAAVTLKFPPCLDMEFMHNALTPVLISFAAILPAAVASLNGVRFQSECTRLADRSRQMSAELCRLAANPTDRGDRKPRMMEVQRLAEDATRLTLGEVAEWSAIYGKDFPEI